MDRIEQLACETALRDMIAKGHFSICTIDKILKISGSVPDKRSYEILSALHCVNYSDMPAGLVQELPELIRSALGGPIIDIDACMGSNEPKRNLHLIEQTPPRPGLFRRLTGT